MRKTPVLGNIYIPKWPANNSDPQKPDVSEVVEGSDGLVIHCREHLERGTGNFRKQLVDPVRDCGPRLYLKVKHCW